MIDLEELRVYLPKYLSSESEKDLFVALKQFPENIDSRLYTSFLDDVSDILQGDGIKDLLVINLPDTEILNYPQVKNGNQRI